MKVTNNDYEKMEEPIRVVRTKGLLCSLFYFK